MNKVLYHFTSPRHVLGCRRHGISKGVVPVTMHPPRFRRGYQWLTENPLKDQTWNEGSTLPYDRTAFRLTVVVPARHAPQLFRWVDVRHRLTRAAEVLDEFGDPENWWLYRGRIPPSWIVAVRDMRKAVGRLIHGEPTP